MSPSTAIIPHPDFPRLDSAPCLENVGRAIEFNGKVNYTKALFLPVADFETWKDSRDYHQPPQRAPMQENEYYIDCRNMARVVRLLDTFTAASPSIMRQIAEMRYRILVTHPHCLDS